MSRPDARHRKSQPRRVADRATPARHRKPSTLATATQWRPGLTVGAVTGAAVLATVVGTTATGWSPLGSSGLGQDAASASAHESALASAAAQQPPGTAVRTARLPVPPQSVAQAGTFHGARPKPSAARSAEYRGRHRAPTPAASAKPAAPPYLNPLRGISGLIPERVDMGVDFGGTGPIYPIGDAVITSASGSNYGWPGGGWITYRLTSGPAAGLTVYVAEDVTPTVQVGQDVTPSTEIANMWAGGDGIETGWGQASTFSAESQLSAAGGISGGGPFPTLVGLNFEQLLQSLGVPAANNVGQSGYGILPAGYPTNWPALLGG
ncbi:MAG: hypothetical protein ACYCO9_18530 [Streptosporangiaceae bacterium]